MRCDGGFSPYRRSVYGMHHGGSRYRLHHAGFAAKPDRAPIERPRHRQISESAREASKVPRADMRIGFARVLSAIVVVGCQGASSTPSSAQSSRIETTGTAVSASRRTAITEAVARVAPSVVTVQTEVVEPVPADVFEQFFGGRSGQRAAAGLGSGFIVRADGAVLTNAHVVAGATRMSVAMKDGTTHPAKLVGIDEANDLAVLKIDARNLPVAPLGSSNNLLIGEWAIAIGNPYGFILANSEPSVTACVVSGTGRNLATQSEGSGVYVDMIQTDASINPG